MVRRGGRSPFKGMEIKVVSETITTHEYESKTLAKAFSEITGIKVKHDIIQEGDVVEKLQTQMQSGKNIYDGWINDSDLIGTHFRYSRRSTLTDWMAGEGKDVTMPTLDLDDFIGKSLHHRARRQALPAARPAVRQPLLVPLRLVRAPRPQGQVQGQVRLRPRRAGQLVGLRGHRRVLHQRREGDRRRPGLRPHGLRQEGPVARLALHRRLAVDGRQRRQGHPERPAGRRMGHPHRKAARPVGSSVARGGDTNGPAAVYALDQVRRLAEEIRPAGGAPA